MMMVTVPLAVLIGAATGMFAAGVVFAAENNEVGEYVVGIVFFCIFSVLVSCGIEALSKAGGV